MAVNQLTALKLVMVKIEVLALLRKELRAKRSKRHTPACHFPFQGATLAISTRDFLSNRNNSLTYCLITIVVLGLFKVG